MNEIIKNLKEQATEDIMGVPVLDADLFAKLIVQECVGVMDITDITDFRGTELALKIKQHFGVE